MKELLKEHWEYLGFRKTWQKILYSIFLVVLIIFMVLVAIWYMSSGHYYNAWF